MYMLQLYFPNGQQQSIYQVYQAPVTGLWMGSISAQEVPDVVMAQMNEGKLIALLLYVWQGDRYVQHHIPAPKTSQLEGYTGQDKIYVRWDQLIRQLQIQQGEQQVWRRLVYKVDQSRWLSEEE